MFLNKKKITILIVTIILIFLIFYFKDTLKRKIKYNSLIKEAFSIILYFDAKIKFSKNINRDFFNNYLLDENKVLIKETNQNFVFLDKKENYKIYTSKYYNVIHNGILHLTERNEDKKKLLIYVQGHGGTPHKFGYFNKLKKNYLSQGYDVFALAMSDKGYNKNNLNFPGIDKSISGHEIFKNFKDPNNPKKKPLSLMLSGNYYLIKKIINSSNYNEVVMIGISGGGWYATMLAAIMPEIDKSISFAGTIPLLLTNFRDNRGDWEQIDSEIYNHLDYWHLYKLSTLDESYKKNRIHIQIYNKKDPCCFMSPYADMMFSASKKINDEKFTIILTDLNKHEIDLELLYSIF